MARGELSFSGIEELQKALDDRANLNDVKKVVQMNGAELQGQMQRRASFTQGYQTGTTKRSIKLTIKDAAFTAVVSPGTNYSPYLIYGTRYMAAQDFFRPSFFEQRIQFIKDLRRLMK